MKNLYVRRLFFSRFLLKFHLLIWTLLIVVTTAVAQQKLIQLDGWNCYINLPADYEQTSNKYPTIVFLPGIGEVGTDANKIIANGPGAYVTQGWNGEVLGVKFIVVSLQPVNTWPSSASIKTRLENLKSKYRIGDVYLTGLSMGGWAVLSYSHEYPTEPKAVVSVEGVIPSAGYNSGDGPWADYIQKYYEAPIKAGQRYVIFEQKNDLRGGSQVIVAANYWKPGSGSYILTNFGGGGHCCWNEFYGGQGKQPGIFSIDGINQNIYEWFARNYLQGNSNNNKAPRANAGPDKTLTLPDNSITLDGSGTDEDGTIVSYSWAKIAGPSSFNILTPGSASTNINGLSQGVYKFQLKVTDNEGAVGLDTVIVTVNPAPNKSPKANAGADQSITLPLNLVSLSGSGTDEDGTIVGFKWSKISGPSSYNIQSPASASTDVSELTEGAYEFELEVTDDKGAKGLDTVKVIVNPAINKPPVANAGSDKTIQLPANSVVLNGSGTDEDGTVVSYSWRKKSGPENFTIVTAEAATTEVNGLVEGTYVFELVVTDDDGASDTASVKVTVNAAENKPPKAMAGSDQEITLPTNSVSLDGSGTDDDGTVIFFRWSKISGPSSFTISNPDEAATNISGLTEGVYEFQLKVTDNDGAFGLDTVKVTVIPAPNKSPKANAGADQTITLPTNTVSLAGSGTDEDGTVVSYQWTKISGPSGYNIVNSGSAVTDVFSLTEGVYSFQLEVTDDKGAKGRDTMQVTVNAAPNKAPTANAGADQTITLPTNTVSLAGSGTDEDGTVVSYQWTKISGPSNYNIVNSGSAVTDVFSLTEGVYSFQLEVTDDKGAKGRDTMQVTVNAAPNKAPTANAGADQTITLPTNTVSLAGSGTDDDGTVVSYQWTKISGPSNYNIVNSGSAVTDVFSLTEGVYSFQLEVTDDKGAKGRDTMQVTVNAAPNKAPTANAGADQTITLPTNKVTLKGSGTDADGTISSYQWTKTAGPSGYTIASPTSATTEVSGLTEGTYTFQLKVTDNKGATGTATVKVTVNAAPNKAPTANAGTDQTITLPTNKVTLKGSGTDADGTISSYQWTKTAGPGSYTIVSPASATTEVTGLAEGTYTFQLKVTDNKGATGTATVKVTVNPAPNKAPKAYAGADKTITLPTNTVSLAGSGTDEDGTVVSYQWTKIAGPSGYNIVNSGSAVTDVFGLTEGVYSFQLEVTDNKGAKGRDTMQVTVNAAPNKAPTANAGTDQTITLPTNKVTLKGSGTDADGTISSYQWTKTAGPGSYTIVSPASATTEVTSLTEGTYTFQLKVTDNKGATGTATVRVTVVAADNQAPTANAGGNKTIVYPESATMLTGSGSDSDGTIEKYAWKQLTGPTIAEIESSGSATTAVSGLAIGNYLFELTVTDNRGAVGKDTMILMVAAARENSYQEGVKLYPNPTSGITTLEITGVKITERLVLVITDATGKVVEKRDVFTAGAYHHLEKVDLRSMRQGIYFVSLITESKVKLTQRVVKL